MISEIHLFNFKQFQEFHIRCRQDNIFVGPNNAGKSTTLDALRIYSDVTRYIGRRNPRKATSDDGELSAYYEISHENISYNYNDRDSKIVIILSNKNKINIILNREKTIKVYCSTDLKIPSNTIQARKFFSVDLIVVPTLGPFEDEEAYLTDGTVNAGVGTRIAHRHFRNFWYRKPEADFDRFNALVQQAWPDIEIHRPQIQFGNKSKVTMMFTESRFLREVHWAGFGFQIWLQMITHAMRGGMESIFVLDEPDIYLHSDLQKRLLKFVKTNYAQYFMATHSTDIINEANPGDIISVEKGRRRASRISNQEGYQKLFSYLGSSENVEFSRMARAKRILFFEGKDKKIVKWIAEKIGGAEAIFDPDTLILQAGGFSQWSRVLSVHWVMSEIFDMDVKVAAIFDHDYRCEEEIQDFKEKMNHPNLLCHVLDRKEIENYALHLPALVSVILKNARIKHPDFSVSEAEKFVIEEIERYASTVRARWTASYLDYFQERQKNVDTYSHVDKAQRLFDKKWIKPEAKLELLPGKEFISSISQISQSEFGRSVTIRKLIDEIPRDSVSLSIKKIISELNAYYLR